jgi:TP901 family phage tail tape measure protein
MATPVELERLVVRLTGESSQWNKMIDQAIIKASSAREALVRNHNIIEESMKQMMEMGSKVFLKAITPLERYQILMRELDALLRTGAIDQETYNRTLEKEYNRLPSVVKAQKDYARALKESEKAAESRAKREKQISDWMTDATKKRLENNLKAAEKAVREEDKAARHVERIRSKFYADEEKRAAAVAKAEEKAARYVERIRSKYYASEEKRAAAVAKAMERIRTKSYLQQEREEKRLTRLAERETTKRLQAVNRFAVKTATVSRQAGMAMSATVTAPIVAFGKTSVSAFTEFDDKMTGSLAIMENVTPTMRKQMEDLAKTISERSKTSADDLAESYFYLASAGMDAQQSISSLSQYEKFAVAGRFTMIKATELLADAQTALGLRSQDNIKNLQNLTRVSDVLVKADTIANATVEQFAKSLTTKAGNALRLLNKDVEEGVAILAAYAAQGVKAELAGERLYIVLRDLERTSRTNAKAWEYFGITVYDSHGKMRKVSDVLRQLETVMHGMSDQERAATFALLGFQDRSVAAIKGLIGMSDAIDGYETQLRSATGFTDQVANKQLASLKSQMAMVQNQVHNIAIDIGQLLLPTIKRVIEYVKSWVVWWKGLTESQKEVVVRNAAIVASIGPILLVLSATITTVRNVTLVVYALTTAMGAANASSLVMKGGMIALAAVVTVLVAKAFYDSNEHIKEFNAQVAKSNHMLSMWTDKRVHDFQRFMKSIDELNEAQQQDALVERLQREQKELEGYKLQLKIANQALEQFDTTWGSMTGNKNLELQKKEVEEFQNKIRMGSDFVQQLKDRLEDLNKPKGPKINFGGMDEGEGGGIDLPDIKAMEKSEKAIDRLDNKLRIHAETLGLTTEEIDVYKAALEGLGGEALRVAYENSQVIKAFDKEKKVLKEMEDAAEKARHPWEKFRIEEAKLIELFEAGRISLAAFRYGVLDLRRDMARDLHLNFKVSGADAVEAGSLAAREKMSAFRLAHILPKAELERVKASRAIGDEFTEGRRVAGFGRKVESEASISTLADLLRGIEENTRPAHGIGRKDRPVVVAPAGLGGSD